MKPIYARRLKTPFGPLVVSATSKGLYSLDLEKSSHRARPSAKQKAPHRVASTLRRAALQLRRYLRGRKTDFRNLPIDWAGYRGFQKRVLQELRRIPRGTTETYQFLARRSGRPKATRYVGRILHLNRLPLVLPCHRIVPKKGGLGGFSKGTRMKQRLLKLEQARVDTT